MESWLQSGGVQDHASQPVLHACGCLHCHLLQPHLVQLPGWSNKKQHRWQKTTKRQLSFWLFNSIIINVALKGTDLKKQRRKNLISAKVGIYYIIMYIIVFIYYFIIYRMPKNVMDIGKVDNLFNWAMTNFMIMFRIPAVFPEHHRGHGVLHCQSHHDHQQCLSTLHQNTEILLLQKIK